LEIGPKYRAGNDSAEQRERPDLLMRGLHSHSGSAQKGTEDEFCFASASSILHCTPVEIKRPPGDDAAVHSATNVAPHDPRALVLEEARKCSLTRLRNLVKKQDPSVAWYAFGRTNLQNWLADNATMSVFGLKTQGKLQKVATPITSTGDWSPAPLPGGWIINPEVDRRTQSKVMPDISQLKIKVSSQEAPGLGHFSWIGQFQRRDDLDFWYCVPPKQRKKRAQRLNPADAAPSSVVVSSSAPFADDTAVTAIHGDASVVISAAEHVALQHLTAPEHDSLNFEPQDDYDSIIDYNTNSGNSLSEHVRSMDVVAGGSDTSDYSSAACLQSSVVDSLELKMGDDSSAPIIAFPTSWSVDDVLLLVLNIFFD
jgi:hypothetical protein